VEFEDKDKQFATSVRYLPVNRHGVRAPIGVISD